MLLDCSKRVVVVTGAGSGIGESVARAFAREGARVAMWERDTGTMAQVADSLRSSGAEVLSVPCDVSQPDQVRQAAAQTIARFGTIDALINNAGIAPYHPIEQMPSSVWDETFAVNTRGVYLCSQAVIPTMKAQRCGRIINASSFAAIVPSFASGAYAASKAAVVSLTRVLAGELGPWNITVNAYAPGMIPSGMNRVQDLPPARQEQLLDSLSLRRWGVSEDIASLMIFLVSDQASYITGSMIEISGGKFAVQFPQLAYQQPNAHA